MQALDKSGWPISEQDVILLENEINKGESYIKQAMELENAAKKHAKKIKRQNSEDYNDATSDGDEEKDGGDDDDDDDDDASTSPKSAGKRNEVSGLQPEDKINESDHGSGDDDDSKPTNSTGHSEEHSDNDKESETN